METDLRDFPLPGDEDAFKIAELAVVCDIPPLAGEADTAWFVLDGVIGLVGSLAGDFFDGELENNTCRDGVTDFPRSLPGDAEDRPAFNTLSNLPLVSLAGDLTADIVDLTATLPGDVDANL